jgi:hypothetical protein
VHEDYSRLIVLRVLLCLCITIAAYRYARYDQPGARLGARIDTFLNLYIFTFALMFAHEILLLYDAVSVRLSLLQRWALEWMH